MKQLYVIATIALMLTPSSASSKKVNATTSEITAQVDSPMRINPIILYKSILEPAAKILSGGNVTTPPEGLEDLKYLMLDFIDNEDGNMPSMERFREIMGYCIRDLDGDGSPELLIGYTGSTCPEGQQATHIVALYKLSDGKPELILSSTGRREWFIEDSGEFYMTGSESAACQVAGLYSYINGQLNCDDFWFSTLNVKGDAEYYHSYYETLDPAKAKRIEYTMNLFCLDGKSDLGTPVRLELTPFSTLRPIFAQSADDGKVRFMALLPLKDSDL